jgi:hypothetical protein
MTNYTKCERNNCNEEAVWFGGRSGSFEWEGAVCDKHSRELDWRGPLDWRPSDWKRNLTNLDPCDIISITTKET